MVEKISYRGWGNTWRLSNGTVELIVLGDVGPRIVWYGFCGGENIFHEVSADSGFMAGIASGSGPKRRAPTSPTIDRCR